MIFVYLFDEESALEQASSGRESIDIFLFFDPITRALINFFLLSGVEGSETLILQPIKLAKPV